MNTACKLGEQSVICVGLKFDIRKVHWALNFIASESQEGSTAMVDRLTAARSEGKPRAAGMELS
jgi:hypothetical protein